MKIGYTRVSTPTDEQSLALQLDALRAAGCERIFSDTSSDAKGSRPGLDEALRSASTNDELIVWRLDRVGRSLSHLINLIEQLSKAGIGFRSLADGLETEPPAGLPATRVIAALAEFERSLTSERRRSDLKPARARGRAGGRKPLAPAKIQALRAMWDSQKMTADEIATQLEIGRRTVFKYLKEQPGARHENDLPDRKPPTAAQRETKGTRRS